MKLNLLAAAAIMATGSLALVSVTACSTEPTTEGGKLGIETDAENAVRKAEASDPSLKTLLDKAAGYAVFPKVGKGAIGVGGAYGKGVLFEAGKIVGFCDMTQATIGLSLGGQGFTQIIAFETPAAVAKFKSGNFAFDAQATAVALKSGAGAAAKYSDGVSVFMLDETGLMASASLGGQKFSYKAK